MGWRHVLFANWPVEASVVESRIPDRLAVDTFDGRAWLSVIPYTNVDVRPTWVPEGWGFRLPELNLRTYVTHDGRPAVYFFSLDAEGLLGVLGARLVHNLPYYYARISLDVGDGRIRFRSERRHPGSRPARFRGSYRSTGDRVTADPGSLAAFLTERYRYYTESQRGALRYADIEHEPWPLYAAEVDVVDNSLFAANGFEHPDSDPVLYYSPGVSTVASRSRSV